MLGKIHSIETCGTVDGPGIRYVIFTQGCPMRCKYCHNPDTWSLEPEKQMSVQELIDDFSHCQSFLKNGGVTVTGGEPMLQMDFLIELFTAFKKKGVHTCIDTSGIVYQENNKQFMEKLDLLLSLTDLVMLDIKHINEEKHIALTGCSNRNIISFANYLAKKSIPVWIRHVVVPEITLLDEDLFELGYFLGSLTNIKALDVLPYHNLGEVKYEQLNIPYPLKDVEPVDKKEAIRARNIILEGMKKRLHEKKA